MKELIKQWLRAIHLEEFARESQILAFCLSRGLTGMDRRIITDYFDQAQVKKLHIGCGENSLEGWLNSDYLPRSNKILRFDATKRFPFKNDEFDYVFSEHMIEHLPYSLGQNMLAECFRVLKSKGKLRISTPNLSFLIDLYRSEKSKIQMEFIKHSTDKDIKYAPYYGDTFVINNYMRDWGHLFIYDEKTLRYSLEKLGFVKITKVGVCDSQDEALRNLENVTRKPPGLIGLESLVIEGMKL